jgi:hypothetical protein
MSFSKESEAYWKGEHVRFLNDDNSIPSVEDRVKAAFDAGRNSIYEYARLNAIATDKCKINFPSWNE